MNTNAAIDTIRRVKLNGLCEFDGCFCGSFSIHGVTVDISCQKSGGSRLPDMPDFFGTVIRVSSPSMDSTVEDLRRVGREVVGQFREFNHDVVVLRLCDGEGHEYAG